MCWYCLSGKAGTAPNTHSSRTGRHQDVTQQSGRGSLTLTRKQRRLGSEERQNTLKGLLSARNTFLVWPGSTRGGHALSVTLALSAAQPWTRLREGDARQEGPGGGPEAAGRRGGRAAASAQGQRRHSDQFARQLLSNTAQSEGSPPSPGLSLWPAWVYACG